MVLWRWAAGGGQAAQARTCPRMLAAAAVVVAAGLTSNARQEGLRGRWATHQISGGHRNRCMQKAAAQEKKTGVCRFSTRTAFARCLCLGAICTMRLILPSLLLVALLCSQAGFGRRGPRGQCFLRPSASHSSAWQGLLWCLGAPEGARPLGRGCRPAAGGAGAGDRGPCNQRVRAPSAGA